MRVSTQRFKSKFKLPKDRPDHESVSCDRRLLNVDLGRRSGRRLHHLPPAEALPMIHATSQAPARRLRVLAEAAGRTILSASPLQRWPLLPVAFSVASSSSLARSCARSVAQKKLPAGELSTRGELYGIAAIRASSSRAASRVQHSRDSVHSADARLSFSPP